MYQSYNGDPYRKGIDDGSLGRTKLSSSHFKSSSEYDTYLNAYAYSNIMVHHVADTLKHVDTITRELLKLFYEYFILRLPYIFPALLLMYFLYKVVGFQGTDLVIPFFVLAIPSSIVLYHYYLYLRGREFAYAMCGKGNSRLLYALCFFTTLISSSLYLFIISKLMTSISVGALSWVFMLLYGYVTWRLVNIVTEFHWNDRLPLKWHSKSKYFGKGVASVLRSDTVFHENKSLKIPQSREMPERKSAIGTVKIISFFILLFLIPVLAITL
jgi:hypothetical protein